MNRRSFLRSFGGGVVATAAMAEAGMLAEFMDWLRRAPVWSFPKKNLFQVPRVPLYNEIDYTTFASFGKPVISSPPTYDELRDLFLKVQSGPQPIGLARHVFS